MQKMVLPNSDRIIFVHFDRFHRRKNASFFFPPVKKYCGQISLNLVILQSTKRGKNRHSKHFQKEILLLVNPLQLQLQIPRQQQMDTLRDLMGYDSPNPVRYKWPCVFLLLNPPQIKLYILRQQQVGYPQRLMRYNSPHPLCVKEACVVTITGPDLDKTIHTTSTVDGIFSAI